MHSIKSYGQTKCMSDIIVLTKRFQNTINFSSVKHRRIFDEIEKQIEITKVFSVIIETRLSIIEENRNPS